MENLQFLREMLNIDNLKELLRPERRVDLIIFISLIIIIIFQFTIIRKLLLIKFKSNPKWYSYFYSFKINFAFAFILWMVAFTIINANLR